MQGVHSEHANDSILILMILKKKKKNYQKRLQLYVLVYIRQPLT